MESVNPLEMSKVAMSWDNSAIVDFLTSTASVLNSNNAISSRELDNLRLAISSLSHPTGESGPLFSRLLQEDNHYIKILVARYGQWGLLSNLFRHSVRKAVDDCIRIVTEMGIDVLQNSRLFFNRPVEVYLRGELEERVLFSSVLVDLSEILAQANSLLLDARNGLNTWIPHALAGSEDSRDRIIDERMAEALDFSGVGKGRFFSQSNQTQFGKIAFALQLVVDAVHATCLQLGGKLGTPFENVSTTIEWMEGELQRLRTARDPEAAALPMQEAYRRSVIQRMYTVNLVLKQIALEFPKALVQVGKYGTTAHEIPNDVKRRLVTRFVREGVSVLEGEKACSDLVTYCATQNIEPQQALPAELSKANSLLKTEALEEVQLYLKNSSLVSGQADEKRTNLRQLELLLENFRHQGALIATVIMLCFLPIWGCGLKTAPQSQILDARPEVPVRPQEGKAP